MSLHIGAPGAVAAGGIPLQLCSFTTLPIPLPPKETCWKAISDSDRNERDHLHINKFNYSGILFLLLIVGHIWY